jgi:hypothetical protein
VGAFVTAPTSLASAAITAPAGPGSSKPLAIPSTARAVSLYDSTNAGASIFGPHTTVRFENALGSPVLLVKGPDLRALGATLIIPPGSKRLIVYNGTSPVGIPALLATAVFHLGK